jgi:hypothetical protein
MTIMRFLFALLAILGIAFGVNGHAHAQGTDTWSCSGDVTVPAGTADTGFTVPLSCARTFTPPPDNPPTVANLSATCDEEVACSGDIGAADDNGFVVSWGVAPGVFIGNADGSWSWQTVDGDGLATYGIPGEVSDGVNPPVPFTLQVTVNDTVQAPPPPAGNLQAILDMPAGSWLAYGVPWSDLQDSGELQSLRDNCGILLSKVITAWQGNAFDGTSFWNLAGPGHGDGCFNGILRYDLDTGLPEVAVPHMPLNMPVCWGPFTKANGEQDCYYEPYASATPAPICSTVSDPNCGGIPLQDRLDAGLSVLSLDAIAAETEGQETFGAFLRPRSSHDYNNTLFLDGYVYLMTGQTYGGIRADAQVWRFAVTDPAGTLERLPNRWNAAAGEPYGNYNANLVAIPGRLPLMFSGQQVCEADMVQGLYTCASHPINVPNTATLIWDEERQGIWAIAPQFDQLNFLRETAGVWDEDPALSVTDLRLSGSEIGRAGICLVPTAAGTNPVLWGTNATLLRWDGTALVEVTGQTGQPATVSSAVMNKWRWNDDLGVCLGLTQWDRGVDAWRPDFSNWEQAGDPPPPDPDPQPGTWPTFAGHTVAPMAVTISAWDEPATLQPEAPDLAALCPDPWAEIHITEPYDSATLKAQIRTLARGTTPNVRVYLHALPDGGVYPNGFTFDEVKCSELVGVPDTSGNRPKIASGIGPGQTGIIARGVDMQGATIGWWGNAPVNQYIRYIVLHDMGISASDTFWGVANSSAPHTYLEMAGNRFGGLTNGHLFYLERSIGNLVAVGNVFEGSGTGKHAFKNLAHRTRLEGNVFSNVGIDGQPLAISNNGDDIIGQPPLDLYLCTETVFRNNTVIFRTANIGRVFVLYRGRNAWGNCNKGERLADGSWEIWRPESVEYDDPVRWAAIQAALADFDQGFQAAFDNPTLFAHINDSNTYIAFNAALTGDGVVIDDTRAAQMESLRPIANNALEADIIGDAAALATSCEGDETCFLAGASERVRYVYDHIDPNARPLFYDRGIPPNAVPIQAPAEWVERAGMFWGGQTYITCDGPGLDCAVTGDRVLQASPLPWDDVQVAHPQRVILLQ